MLISGTLGEPAKADIVLAALEHFSMLFTFINNDFPIHCLLKRTDETPFLQLLITAKKILLLPKI